MHRRERQDRVQPPFVHEHDAESVLTRLREGEACRMEAELRTQAARAGTC